jgi:serine/threonine protein kinase
MTIEKGTRIGHYKILSSIGKGGMGEVYLAEDTRLDRKVAVKVLPADLLSDEDRLQRFELEAKATSALNHPNILTVHDFGRHDGAPFITSELLEGEELRQLLDERTIPLRKTIDYAQQIVSGLTAAHGKGIVHRDLKPENLFITKDDRIKILDFGLAKLRETDNNVHGSEDATRKALTDPGMVMGTVGYMSPEQVRGALIDHRSDIFSFGVILYEMITGQRAFQEESLAETMSAIVKEEPPEMAESNPNVNPALERIVHRCLEKKPEQRFQSTADLGFALDSLSPSTSSSGENRTETMLSPDRSGVLKPGGWRYRVWQIAFAIAAVLALVFGLSLIRGIGTKTNEAPLRRFALSIPSNGAPNWNDFGVMISPDGSRIAYNCREGNAVSICLRNLDSLSVQRVAEGRDADYWFFSPDGEWIGIADQTGLSKVSIRGGSPQVIHSWLDNEPERGGFSWGPDGYILFGTASGLRRVSSTGGTPEVVTKVVSGGDVTGHYSPSALPGGETVLITIALADGSSTGGLVNLSDGSVLDLGISGRHFVYVEPGWIAFRQGTTLMASEFDPADPTRPSNPTPIIQNVGADHAVAADGTLIYIPTRGESNARLVWVDRDGRPTAVGNERLEYTHLDLSPDGRQALLNVVGGEIDLIDLQSGTRKLVANGAFPIWSSDGRQVTYSGTEGLQRAPVDGSAPPELLVSYKGFVVPTSWNAVTGDLAYYDHRKFEIWVRQPDGATRRFLDGTGRKRSGRFSPDGKWMAFVSDETGEYQVYVTAYPGPGPTVAVSTKGGLSPFWSADGRDLFFRLGEKVLTARMSSTLPLAFDVPVELYDGPYTLDLMGHQREDVGPDGRFLMVENSDDFPIVIVQNWTVELRRLVK